MHYRRMDPQPSRYAQLKGLMVAGKLVYDVDQPGWWEQIAPPRDMPLAWPWQDREGTWYWRMYGRAVG